MTRIFISPERIKGDLIQIDEGQARHIEKVLRLSKGDKLSAFDGQGNEYEISLIGRQEGILIGEISHLLHRSKDSLGGVSLVQGIAKGSKMDSIIQKATEIGIKNIYPLLSRYTVVKLSGEQLLKKKERWQVIAREACKQCRRNTIPLIMPPASWSDIISEIKLPAIMLYEKEINNSLRVVIRENRDQLEQKEITLIVGPEGGFSEDEVEMARQKGVLLAGLGPLILRTETAGLVAASIVLYELGYLG